jgi:hypothetical protein
MCDITSPWSHQRPASSAPSAPRRPRQTVTFRPYIQPGDNGPFGPTDQMIVTWQTDETHPNAYAVELGRSLAQLVAAPISGRVVDDYLSADRHRSTTSCRTR